MQQVEKHSSGRENIDDAAQNILFREARTYTSWLEKEVDDALLHDIYDLMKFGPTSANCCPLRLVFVKSPEAKEKLKPALMEGNVKQTMTAPVTVIMANDMAFYEHLPILYPQTDARSWFVGAGKESYAQETAMRNGSLQAAYFMLAARGLGLDCGPMSGFNPGQVKQAFFPDSKYEANMLCNLGYGDPAGLYPRNPRLTFEQACEIV